MRLGYIIYTHNHSVSLAKWCLNSLLSSHHCPYLGHLHTVHSHCKRRANNHNVRLIRWKTSARRRHRLISSTVTKRAFVASILFSNFPPLTSSPGHPLLPAVRLTHCTEPISCQITVSNRWLQHRQAGDIIPRTPAGMIKSISVSRIQTAGYLHFSCNESGQLRQEQEEYEDAAEDGDCGQTHRG